MRKLDRMAKHSSDILALARRGAQHRYEELIEELEYLARQFPDLRAGARAVVKRGRKAVQAVKAQIGASDKDVQVGPKPRRKMSAKARKAISDAQKKRWARTKGAAKKE
jgi:hypothetical protein